MKYLSKAKPRDIAGTALLRLDFNTEDEWRMEASLPTVRFLMKHAAKIVIVSHRGRPEGYDKKFSLERDAKRLSRYLRKPVQFVNNTHFADISMAVARAPRRSVLLLENLRFWPGEGTNDDSFAHSLAGLANYYVNDAFAVAHRTAASVVAVTEHLPSYVGFGLENEIKHLSQLSEHPKKPFVVVLGGGKAHDKLGVIRYFRRRADWFLLGGTAANTVMKLRGVNVKKSIIDTDAHDTPFLRSAAHDKHVLTPVDWKIKRAMILDIGPKTVKLFTEKIRSAKTILWSGPMGLIEDAKFRKGNLALAKAVAANRGVFSVTGGGETVMFLKKYKLDRKFSFISTGGGAMLDFLAGESLPGIEALKRK
ncbi:MAG: hypothetical protein RL681_301 [Candidatus Parcubacteria bacterium]|jgi:3-phosphoglycerate kinase